MRIGGGGLWSLGVRFVGWQKWCFQRGFGCKFRFVVSEEVEPAFSVCLVCGWEFWVFFLKMVVGCASCCCCCCCCVRHSHMSLPCPWFSSEMAEEEVKTLFLSGLPDDIKEREIYNLFRNFEGYESCQLKYSGRGYQVPLLDSLKWNECILNYLFVYSRTWGYDGASLSCWGKRRRLIWSLWYLLSNASMEFINAFSPQHTLIWPLSCFPMGL